MTAEEIIDARVRALKSAGNLVPSQAAPPSGVRALEQAVQNNGGKVFGTAAAQPEVHYPFSNLTICVITRDEDKHYLGDLWLSVMPLIEQGAATSIVHTVKSEKEFAEVLNKDEYSTLARYHYTGNFNFGRAKNIALDCVLTEWVLFLDSDERLNLDASAVLSIINNPDLDAAYCKVHSIYAPFTDVVPCTSDSENIQLREDDISPQIRIFRVNRHRQDGRHEIGRYRFTEGMHEQIKPSIVERGGMVSDSAIRVFHVGYKNPAYNFTKAMRNVQGLAAGLEQNSDLTDVNTTYRLWKLFDEMQSIEHLRPVVNAAMKPMKGSTRG